MNSYGCLECDLCYCVGFDFYLCMNCLYCCVCLGVCCCWNLCGLY